MLVDFLRVCTRLALVGAAALSLAQAARAAPSPPEPPIGNWLTQDRDAVITTLPCGNAICGQISGIPLAIPGEPIPTDNQHRSQCHLTILWGAVPAGSEWRGHILDPRDGKTYSILLSLDAQRRLKVRGYIGIPLLGRTQTWTPFTAPLPADCRLPPRDPPGGLGAAPAPPGRADSSAEPQPPA